MRTMAFLPVPKPNKEILAQVNAAAKIHPWLDACRAQRRLPGTWFAAHVDTSHCIQFRYGTRVHTFDASAGTESGELRSYDVTARLNPSTQMYSPIGAGVPLSPGSGTGVSAMTPDGGNVFVVGTAAVFVQTSPL